MLLCCIVILFFHLFLSLGDEIKLLIPVDNVSVPCDHIIRTYVGLEDSKAEVVA